MKTMNCKQLGGACEKEFQADSFEEIAEMSKKHGIEMLKINLITPVAQLPSQWLLNNGTV